jgi:hypothetical protein
MFLSRVSRWFLTERGKPFQAPDEVVSFLLAGLKLERRLGGSFVRRKLVQDRAIGSGVADLVAPWTDVRLEVFSPNQIGPGRGLGQRNDPCAILCALYIDDDTRASHPTVLKES